MGWQQQCFVPCRGFVTWILESLLPNYYEYILSSAIVIVRPKIMVKGAVMFTGGGCKSGNCAIRPLGNRELLFCHAPDSGPPITMHE